MRRNKEEVFTLMDGRATSRWREAGSPETISECLDEYEKERYVLLHGTLKECKNAIKEGYIGDNLMIVNLRNEHVYR